jgi:uncharacterized membrane protein
MRRTILIVFFALLVAYALFQARFVILGPNITIISPKDNTTLDSNVVTVSGRAQNVAYLSLDGRQIYTDNNGYWSEKLIAPEGISILELTARDRFGRETKKTIRVVLN